MQLNHLFILIVLVVATSCGGNSGQQAAPARQGQRGLAVDAIVVNQVSLDQNITVTGTLLPSEEVELKAENTGKLVELNIEEGKRVTKGQLLARVNDNEIRARLSKLEIDLKLAQEDLDRKVRLKEINAISQQELDVALNRVDGLKADMQQAKAQVEKSEVRAPFDGTIGLRFVSPGTFVGANTVLAKLVQDNPLKLEFSVPERYAQGVEKGMKASFSLGHNPTLNEATVYAFEPLIDPATRSLKVRAWVQNPSGKLLAGSFARVNLKFNTHSKTIIIPPHALVPVLGGQSVVLAKGGKAVFQPVEIGLRTATEVEVVSGIQPNDTLLVSGLIQVRNGMPISVMVTKP